MQHVATGLERRLIEEADVDERLIERCLDTRDSPPPGLLIRTSGEVRLSDFLLWQTSYSAIYFTPVLWPEFALKHLCLAVVHYQRSLPTIKVTPPRFRHTCRSRSRTNRKFFDTGGTGGAEGSRRAEGNGGEHRRRPERRMAALSKLARRELDAGNGRGRDTLPPRCTVSIMKPFRREKQTNKQTTR